MKQAATYLIATIVFAALGISLGHRWLILLWPTVGMFVLALGYLGFGPGVLGKRRSGKLAWWGILLHLPYLVVTRLIQVVKRGFSKEPLYNEVTPGLWIGRRVSADQLPPEAAIVIDLAAEFAEVPSTRRKVEYHSVPALNYYVPDMRRLRQVVGHLARRPEGIYVHCAQGHGRSALAVAALLLARGLARNAAEAEAMVVRVRPRVHLESSQRAQLKQYAAYLTANNDWQQ
jgi:protein-tyrosine phosphatase